ncbi:MAG: hypothetical protein N2C12_09755 [Planctomycetales bacterium]
MAGGVELESLAAGAAGWLEAGGVPVLVGEAPAAALVVFAGVAGAAALVAFAGADAALVVFA